MLVVDIDRKLGSDPGDNSISDMLINCVAEIVEKRKYCLR